MNKINFRDICVFFVFLFLTYLEFVYGFFNEEYSYLMLCLFLFRWLSNKQTKYQIKIQYSPGIKSLIEGNRLKGILVFLVALIPAYFVSDGDYELYIIVLIFSVLLFFYKYTYSKPDYKNRSRSSRVLGFFGIIIGAVFSMFIVHIIIFHFFKNTELMLDHLPNIIGFAVMFYLMHLNEIKNREHS